jgi:hypothetical protein
LRACTQAWQSTPSFVMQNEVKHLCLFLFFNKRAEMLTPSFTHDKEGGLGDFTNGQRLEVKSPQKIKMLFFNFYPNS